MGPVDRSLVLRKISELEIYHRQIDEFSGITVRDYKEDWKTQRIVERTLQMMVETCVDIANHIISEAGMRMPTSYADTFKVLFENNLVDPDLFTALEKMAKFRNVVVHQYEVVDAEIVVLILKKNLLDFQKFREAISTYLKNLSH